MPLHVAGGDARRVIGTIIFLVLACTVPMLAVAHLPPNYAAAAWAFVPERKRET